MYVLRAVGGLWFDIVRAFVCACVVAFALGSLGLAIAYPFPDSWELYIFAPFGILGSLAILAGCPYLIWRWRR